MERAINISNLPFNFDIEQVMKRELIKSIYEAMAILYERDKYLIHDGNSSDSKEENHVSEMAVVFQFGSYLKDILAKNKMFAVYDIDTEYNKNIRDEKLVADGSIRGKRPDLIIHKRGTNKHNLLIAEFKGWWNNSQSAVNEDKDKIKLFMYKDVAEEYRYEYTYGLFVMFGKEKSEMEWFEDGTAPTAL